MSSWNNFDLNLLRVFEALHRDRSVSLAAEALGLSQPAVSNALSRLRAALGDPLFVRTRGGMEPTPFALSLREPIHDGLQQVRAALGQKASFDPLTCSDVRTLIMTDVGEASFLPSLMQALAERAPNLGLKVIERAAQDYEASLDSGEADLAIGTVTLSSSFRSAHLRRGTYAAVFAAGNPILDMGQAPSLDAYLAANHIAISPGGQTGNPVDDHLTSIGLHRKIVLTIPHAMALATLLPNGRLVATVPDRCAVSLTRDTRLRWAGLPFEMPESEVCLWWHKRSDADPLHVWLRALLHGIA